MKYNQHQGSTKHCYHKVWNKFNEFLIRLDKKPQTWEERVSLYCGYLVYVRQVKSATLKSYVSAIKSTLEADGYNWSLDRCLLSSFARSCRLNNDIVKTRLPIRGGLLELILFELERLYRESQFLS